VFFHKFDNFSRKTNSIARLIFVAKQEILWLGSNLHGPLKTGPCLCEWR